MSELTQAMLVNGIVLVLVLHTDVGRNRKIGAGRILRPFLAAAAIIPLFIAPVATHGTGLTVELAATIAGLLGGLAAVALMSVHGSPATGRPVSEAGRSYALLWIGVIGARAAFSYGADHWFGRQLADWCINHQVTTGAITDALIFMAIAMLLVRTLGLGIRARRLTSPAARLVASQPAGPAGS